MLLYVKTMSVVLVTVTTEDITIDCSCAKFTCLTHWIVSCSPLEVQYFYTLIIYLFQLNHFSCCYSTQMLYCTYDYEPKTLSTYTSQYTNNNTIKYQHQFCIWMCADKLVKKIFTFCYKFTTYYCVGFVINIVYKCITCPKCLYFHPSCSTMKHKGMHS